MKIHTNNFEEVHGNTPRGFGSWAFMIGRNGSWSEPMIYHGMMYTEAKKCAVRDARADGASEIIVCSQGEI